MEAAYVSAVSGVLGVTVGGLTSFLSMWMTQRLQLEDAHRHADRAKLEALFGDFISEATRLYIDALSHEKDEVGDFVRLYALVAKIRFQASPEVIAAAEQAMDTITAAYLSPNRTLHELRSMARSGEINFLHAFGERCRQEIAKPRRL